MSKNKTKILESTRQQKLIMGGNKIWKINIKFENLWGIAKKVREKSLTMKA